MKELEVKSLTKRYGSVHALEDISFTLKPGHIYGLLGRNGAGKTTLVNILANRQFPTGGEVLYAGDCLQENDAAQAEIFCMGEATLYPEGMRVREAVRTAAHFYPRFDREGCALLLRKFALEERKKIKSLSTGYSSILKLILALSSGAELLLLDEPVLGLDANHRELFYETLLQLFAKGETTVLLSTHLIGEVAEIIDEVLILDGGRLLLSGSVEELKRYATVIAGGIAAVDAAIAGREVLSSRTLGAERIACVRGEYASVPEGVRLSQPGLQQLFVQLTNKNLPEEEALYEQAF